jgi:hypothetical protein
MTRLVKGSFPILALTFLSLPNLQSATIISQTFSGSLPATITGTLPNQDTALEEVFSLTSPSNLTIFTTSYSSGGFEPNISLYNANGGYIASSMVPGSGNAKPDPTTGLALDTALNALNLTAGKYTVALTDWELNQSSTATNLSDGFNFNLGSGTTFVDVDVCGRDG